MNQNIDPTVNLKPRTHPQPQAQNPQPISPEILMYYGVLAHRSAALVGFSISYSSEAGCGAGLRGLEGLQLSPNPISPKPQT